MLPKYLLTFVCLILWLLTFSVGAFVDTNPIRANLAHQFKIVDFLLIVIAWIPTNLAILSILPGLEAAEASLPSPGRLDKRYKANFQQRKNNSLKIKANFAKARPNSFKKAKPSKPNSPLKKQNWSK